jgi:hypothetical protein
LGRIWMFWVAFVCAIGIHIGTVALAKSKSEIAKLMAFNPVQDADEVIYSEPEPRLPEVPIVPLPVEELRPDEDTFHEESSNRRPVRSRNPARFATFLRGTKPSVHSIKTAVLSAPLPVYPYEARRKRITGSGSRS